MTSNDTDNECAFQTPLFAGVDVGGTNVKVGLVDDDGRVVAQSKFPTQQELGPQFAIDRAQETLTQLLASSDFVWGDVAAAGLGTPGPMDIPRGWILSPTNLPAWQDFPVRDELSKALGLPVSYINDAAAAAFGEFWVGGGRDHSSMVLITLGTGVGGGIIVDELSIDGAHSHGSEVGHIVVDSGPDAEICGCGQPGHLEAYASATALVKRAQKAMIDAPQSRLAQWVTETSPLSAKMISEAAQQDDALAIRLVDETASYLARGITTLAHVIDPSAFFLGGAMNFGGSQSPLGERFLHRVIIEVKKVSFPVLADNLVIEFAHLGGEAGFVGAAGIGRRDYHRASLANS